MPDPTQPKLRGYCSALYEHLFAESKMEMVDEAELRVWTGYITKAVRSLGIPDGTYKRITNKLIELGCIEQLQRGFRGNVPSVFILHKAPTQEAFESSERKISLPDLTGRDSPAMIPRRIAELERRLEGVNIKEALVELQQQIDGLKRRFAQQDDNNKSSNTQGEIS